MLNRSTTRLVARVIVLTLIFSAFGTFNTGSTLAANNSKVKPQAAGSQDSTSTTQTAGSQDSTSQLNGQLIANGPVTVNGNKVITGTTVFTDSNIAVDCVKGNSAVINLGKLGRIDLVAGTKMTLRFSDGLISGELQDGKAIISAPQDVKVEVKTADGVVTSNCVQQTVQQTSTCVTPVAVQGYTQCVPVVAAAPAPVPIPVGGLSGWAIGGIVGGAAAVTAGAVAVADDDDDGLFVPLVGVSPVAP
jgi:hypothetical protein